MAAGWGRPDFICLTGVLSRSNELADRIAKRVGGFLPIVRVRDVGQVPSEIGDGDAVHRSLCDRII